MQLHRLLAIFATCCALIGNAALAATGLPTPSLYPVSFLSGVLHIDGKLEEAEWRKVNYTDYFVHHDSGKRAALHTQAKLLYDDHCLYVGIETEDADIYAHFTHNGDPLFKRDDLVEFFIDPLGRRENYIELGISASGYSYSLQIPRADNGRVQPEILSLTGVEHAISWQGTLNNPQDKDRGWSLEACIPFAAIARAIPSLAIPPRNAEPWRLGLFRIDYDHQSQDWKGLGFYAWQTVGSFGFHRPQRFGFIQFIAPEAAQPDNKKIRTSGQ